MHTISVISVQETSDSKYHALALEYSPELASFGYVYSSVNTTCIDIALEVEHRLFAREHPILGYPRVGV